MDVVAPPVMVVGKSRKYVLQRVREDTYLSIKWNPRLLPGSLGPCRTWGAHDFIIAALSKMVRKTSRLQVRFTYQVVFRGRRERGAPPIET